MKRLTKRIAFRLILPLTLGVATVSAIFGYIDVQVQEKQLIDELVVGADQLSRSITSATWQSMLADRRESAYEVMRTIGTKQGIETIRFFNKEGEVTFSTDPDSAPRVDKNAEACFLCHSREEPLVGVDVPSRARIFRAPDGGRKLAMVTPIYNEPQCSSASCHAHPASRNVLGVLDIVMSIDHIDREAAGIHTRTFWMVLVQVMLIGVLTYVVTHRSVSRPIRDLIGATKAVSQMDLDRKIEVKTSGELAELAASFDAMRVRLKGAVDEVNAFTRDLESAVEERTRELGLAQERLVQSDRLASLGQLAASVAHEINNPIAGILNFTMLMRRLITEEGIPEGREEDFRKYLVIASEETARVGSIVSDLLSFSRRSAPRVSEEDLGSIIDHTASLVAHKLELSGVSLELDIDRTAPRIFCDRSQVEQVIINLVMNACEAMPDGGRVRIRTGYDREDDAAVLRVDDDGPGIPEEIRSRIFDPFVSTKEDGKGVGVGLAVVYGIVDSHGGRIDVESEAGRGTTFTVTFPRRGEPGASAARDEGRGSA